MNRKNKNSFDKISGAAATFQTAITEALFKLRQADAQAKAECEEYKDSEGRYKAQRAALIANARNSIDSAKKTFKSAVESEITPLREELNTHVMSSPNPALMNNLRVFRDFGLQPTKSDINAMLKMSGGNTLALRAVNAVLESTKSPLRLSFPDVGAFERDLDALEKLTGENAWTPMDFHKEACVIYGGQPRPNFPGFSWDSVSLLTERASFETKIKELDEMATRWTQDIIPSVEQVKEEYHDSTDGSAAEQYISDRETTGAGATVERSKAPDVERAAQMAKTISAESKVAQAVLAAYRGDA